MEWLQQCLEVGAVLALLGVAAWALHRRGLLKVRFSAGRSASPLESRDRLALSSHHTLHLVRAGELGLLLAVYPGGCTLLESRPWLEWSRCFTKEKP